MKIHSVGAQLLLADRQIDITKLIVAFLNFQEAPKNEVYLKYAIPISLKFNILKIIAFSYCFEIHCLHMNLTL